LGVCHARTFILRCAFSKIPPDHLKAIVNIVKRDLANDDKFVIKQHALECSEPIIIHSLFLEDLMPLIANGLNDNTTEIKLTTFKVIKRFAKENQDACKQYFNILIPPLMERVKERTVLPVKIGAERTLLAVLRPNSNPNRLADYLKTVQTPTDRNALADYNKRVLSKLNEESDDEKSSESQ